MDKGRGRRPTWNRKPAAKNTRGVMARAAPRGPLLRRPLTASPQIVRVRGPSGQARFTVEPVDTLSSLLEKVRVAKAECTARTQRRP